MHVEVDYSPQEHGDERAGRGAADHARHDALLPQGTQQAHVVVAEVRAAGKP